jgi:hypothetical protein
MLGVTGALTRVLPAATGPVNVIGAGLDESIEVEIEVLAKHALEMGSGDNVKEVRDHTIGDKRLALTVEI